MSWNYRIVKSTFRTEAGVTETYRIHEVYYRTDGSIESWSVEPIAPYGEDVAELKTDIIYMLAAFDKPVLVERGSTLVEVSP
jgi:hypothetical protein